MTAGFVLPHIDQLLRGLQITHARLTSRTKIAIDTAILRALLQSAVAALPFDAAFYRARNPDIDAAFLAGKIADLHGHFIEAGYLEGRFGAAPQVDEAFYLNAYPDVGESIARGHSPSALEHYLRCGAAEGRVPRAELLADIDRWTAVLGE